MTSIKEAHFFGLSVVRGKSALPDPTQGTRRPGHQPLLGRLGGGGPQGHGDTSVLMCTQVIWASARGSEHTHMCTHSGSHTHKYTRHAHTYTNTHTHTHLNTHRACSHTQCRLTHIYSRAHSTHLHTYAHTYTRAHTPHTYSCMCTCFTCTCTHAHIHILAHVRTLHVHVYTLTFTHVHNSVHMHTHILTHVHTHILTHMHTMHTVCTRTYTHTRAHTHLAFSGREGRAESWSPLVLSGANSVQNPGLGLFLGFCCPGADCVWGSGNTCPGAEPWVQKKPFLEL